LETNDIVTKNFESYADVAADIINVLLHEGRRRVKDYEMLSAATESLYLDKENGLRNQLEDVAKYHVVNGVPKVLYLFANQTKVDKGMVLRKAGYAGGEYRRQYEKQNPGLFGAGDDADCGLRERPTAAKRQLLFTRPFEGERT